MTRPARKAPTLAIKLAACERRLCQLLGTAKIEYDHRPALWEREVNADGTDYIPPQRDPAYIEALSKEEHSLRTNGNGATSYGSDAHNRAKEDRLLGLTKTGPKRLMQSRPFQKTPEGYRAWPKRPLGKTEGRRG